MISAFITLIQLHEHYSLVSYFNKSSLILQEIWILIFSVVLGNYLTILFYFPHYLFYIGSSSCFQMQTKIYSSEIPLCAFTAHLLLISKQKLGRSRFRYLATREKSHKSCENIRRSKVSASQKGINCKNKGTLTSRRKSRIRCVNCWFVCCCDLSSTHLKKIFRFWSSSMFCE